MDRRWKCFGFSFSRLEGIGRRDIFWPDVHLGVTSGGRYLERSLKLVIAGYRLWKHQEMFSEKNIYYAFNIDNLLLALFARALGNGRGYLVYECADIQPLFISRKIGGALMRAVEKWALKKIDLLVTTSPKFVESYFAAVQDYSGRIAILENKIYPTIKLEVNSIRAAHGIMVIGYFGSFRCKRSLEIIARLGELLRTKVKFLLAGFPTQECASLLRRCVSNSEGAIEYLGRFSYPSDLPRLYGAVDVCWGFDWSSEQGNSRWLLPNRLYESGYFAVPILANRDSYLGELIEREGWGWTFAEPILDTLQLWIQVTSFDKLAEVSRRLELHRNTRFAGESDYDHLSMQLRQENELYRHAY